MSKFDLISIEDRAAARTDGWDLVVVIDGGTGRVTARVLPLEFNERTPNAHVALQQVVQRARLHGAFDLERRVLRAMYEFNTKGTA